MSWLSEVTEGFDWMSATPLGGLAGLMGLDNMGDDAADEINDLNTQIYAMIQSQIVINNTLTAQAANMSNLADLQAGIDVASKRPNIDLQNTISGFNMTALMQKYTQPPKLPTISG